MPKKKTTTHHHEHSHQNSSSKLLQPTKLRPSVLVTVMGLVALVGIFVIYRSFAAGGDTMTLVATTPATTNVSLGSNITVTINENSNTDQVASLETDISYDPAKLQYVSSSTTINTNFNAGNGSCLTPTVTSGSVLIGCAHYGDPAAAGYVPVVGSQNIATVTFTPIATGSTTISFAGTSKLVATNLTNPLITTTGITYNVSDTTPPTTPTGLTAGVKTVTSNAFSWTASTDNVAVTGYKVFRNGTLLNGNVGTTSFTDTGLTPNTSYTYTVQAFDAAGNSSTSSTGLAMVTAADIAAPSVPTGLTAGAKTINSIGLSWSASTDNVAVVGYNILRNGTKVGTSGTTSFNDTGLAPGTSYTYTVQAYDAVPNTSAASTGLAIATNADLQAPTVPTGLVSSAQTVNSISLSWTASTDNSGSIAHYTVYRNGAPIASPTTTSYIDTGLLQNTSYTYTVQAVDASNNASAQTAGSVFATSTKAGDINSDGVVDVKDLAILAADFRKTGQTFAQGDLNNDTVVDIIDFGILALHWGT